MNHEPTISDIYYRLGSLESKLDGVLDAHQATSRHHKERLDDHEDRLQTLEQAEAKRTGVIVVLVGLCSFVASMVVDFITSHINFN